MTTVAQLIEYLSTLPQDTKVRVLCETRGSYDSSSSYQDADFSNIGNIEYLRACEHGPAMLYFGES